MKNNSVILVLFGLLLFQMRELKGQLYTIPDANFRNYIATQFPTVVNGSQQLILANAKVLAVPISCSGLNISNLSGVEYFYKATMINCDNNPISALPALDSLKSLKFLWANGCNLTQPPVVNHISTLEILDLKSNQLTSLPTLTGLVNLNYFDCSDNQLTTLPSLTGLVSLKKFYCYSNQLTQLPSFDGLSSLEWIDCPNNYLTSLPDLSTLTQVKNLRCSYNKLTSLPSLSTLPNLIELSVDHNKLTQLPDLSSASLLEILKVSNNQLTSIPDLSGFTALTSVILQNNQLSFQDLLPQTLHPSFASAFQVIPQDTLLNYPVQVISKDAAYNVLAGVDAGILSNTYTWYKDGISLSVSAEMVTIDPPKGTDAGFYLCEIVNSSPLLVGLKLVAKSAKITVGNCFSTSVLNYTVQSNKCMEGAQLLFDLSSVTNSYKPFNIQLLPLNNQNNYSFSSINISGVEPGEYDLKVVDANNCSIVLKKYMKISIPEDCDNIITPNGDGVDDNYFISKTGNAKVYSKAGVLIKELSLPNHWDGLDASGKLVPMGYYVILVNEKNKIGVVVLE